MQISWRHIEAYGPKVYKCAYWGTTGGPSRVTWDITKMKAHTITY